MHRRILFVLLSFAIGGALAFHAADDWLPAMLAWNKLPPDQRFNQAMQARGLFRVETYTASE